MPRTRKVSLRRTFNTLVCTAITLLLVGCDTLGPRAVRQGRNNYNKAIMETNSEQFLLNIVRVRYNDTPYVLDISSISSRLEFESQISGLSASGGRDSENLIGGHVGYSEKPTIIYQPLLGKDFVRQLMTPVDLDTLVLLRQSGWEIDDILRVFANEINGIPNASTGADSTPEGVPEFREFQKVSEALDEIEDDGNLILGVVGTKEKNRILLQVKPNVRDTQEFADFTRLLKLDPNAKEYTLQLGLGGGGGDKILIETRPILSAMFYVGQSIEIPLEHRRRGFVHQNLDSSGQPYDWGQVHQDLITIKSSASEPEEAAIAVFYEDYWFYVDRDDVDSRETLTMLSIVFTLQAGGSEARAPLLTIPVN
jgi:hypothetical protein